MVLKNPTLIDRLSPRAIERLAEQWVWANTSQEDRDKARKDEEFKAWAEQAAQPGWVPTAQDLRKAHIKR